MSDVSFDLNGKLYSVPVCPWCGDESLSFDAGMMAGAIRCRACGYRIVRGDIFEAMDAWKAAAEIDNKTYTNDHDTSSIPGHTEPDCDDSSEVFDDHRRNDTLPPVFANIVFDLTEPEGERRLREMLDAPKMKLVLWEFDQWLRNQLKYSESPDCCVEQLNIARKYFCLACDDHGIRLDEE